MYLIFNVAIPITTTTTNSSSTTTTIIGKEKKKERKEVIYDCGFQTNVMTQM